MTILINNVEYPLLVQYFASDLLVVFKSCRVNSSSKCNSAMNVHVVVDSISLCSAAPLAGGEVHLFFFFLKIGAMKRRLAI